MRPEDLAAAIDHRSESESVDYKASFDPSQGAEWLELIKDVVAFANSGGGAIIVGIADSGDVVGCDITSLKKIDPAELTDKVHKYTGHQFKDFSFVPVEVEGKPLFAVLVGGVTVPLVFSKPGTYDIGGGKQRTAFSAGTV
jgi:predicted HTH transcriptional regulator